MEANKTFGDYLREQLDSPKDVVKPPALPKKVLPPVQDPKVDEIVEKIKKEDKKKKDIKIPEVDPTTTKQKINKIDIEDVYKKVTQILIAQDEAAKRLIVEIARKEMHPKKKMEGILLTGPTGVGKTELMRLVSRYIDRPFIKVDSTQLTVPGYVGKDIEEVLWDLYVKCGKDKDKAEHAIIYFDEIDKKGSEKKNDVNASGVLNVLLPFIEGSTYDAAPDSKSTSPKVKIDTSNMTVILGGAFTDVYKHLVEKNTIGFGTEKNSLDKPTYRKAETKDFVEHGLMTDEFMGRVTVIRLNDLDLEDLKRVMLEGNESAIKTQEKIFKDLGVKIKFTDGYINKVAEKALEKKTGARGLNGIIDESTVKVFEEVYQNEDLYTQAVLTEKTVDDNTNYRLVKRRQKNKK
jgi:ATP-dependent Clp protease ATP-binding subunit ClpX